MTEPSSNILDAALKRVQELDPRLAATLRGEVEALRDGRKFGLVFNRHLPESVRLPNHPIKRGVKVALRNPHAVGTGKTVQVLKDATWRITRIENVDGNRIAHLDDGEARLVDELVVVREFGEPVYPGLRSVERIDRGQTGDPVHLIINGENHHALQALQFTHRGKVDLIYIDPPYNTGNQGWIYNDKYVDVTRGDASSNWLSFMERRLLIARDLLKDTGVIFVAIGDDEHHRLRMLLDQVFGSQNFISNVVWQGGRKNDSRYVSNGADYMLVYAFSEPNLAEREIRFREKKPGVDEALTAASRIWEEANRDREAATKMWRMWLKGFKKAGLASDAVTRFVQLDESGRPIRTDADLRSPNPRPNLQYDLLHPATGEPVRRHPNGWRYSRETMDVMIERGLIAFGPDHTTGAGGVSYLDNMDTQVPESVFVRDRNPSGRHLSAILGDRRFPNPKDHEVLMRWLRLVAPKDGVVLDFFGGSGTTAEAVMRLNAEDSGTRQAILVTNNELSADEAKRLTKDGLVPGETDWEARGVFEHVTRPRISTVVTGTRPDGSTYSEGLLANVEFLELVYLDDSKVTRAREFDAIAPLLWMQTGAVGERISTEAPAGYTVTDHYGVLHNEDAAAAFLKEVAATGCAHVFVVTDSASHFEHVTSRLPTGTSATQLYSSYLRNFEINVEAR